MNHIEQMYHPHLLKMEHAVNYVLLENLIFSSPCFAGLLLKHY